jgi:hypothetical protein
MNPSNTFTGLKRTLILALIVFVATSIVLSLPVWWLVFHSSINQDWAFVGYAIEAVFILIATIPTLLALSGLYLAFRSHDQNSLYKASRYSLTIGIIFIVLCCLVLLSSLHIKTSQQEAALFIIFASSTLLSGVGAYVARKCKG